MPEQITDDARRAITLARQESRALGRAPFCTGHLLLGLLRHENAFAARALGALGVTPQDARAHVLRLIEDEYHGESEGRKNRALRRLRQDWRKPAAHNPPPEDVLERAGGGALRQAEVFGHRHIGTPHLLLALLEEPESVAFRTLADLGIEPPQVRRTVMEMVRGGQYREKKRGGLHNFCRKGRGGVSIRLDLLGDDGLARELEELLVLTGIVEIPEENSSPPGLPSGERNETPEPDDALAARIDWAVEKLGMRIETMRDDLSGLELAHEKLSELIEPGGRGRAAGGSTDG